MIYQSKDENDRNNTSLEFPLFEKIMKIKNVKRFGYKAEFIIFHKKSESSCFAHRIRNDFNRYS